MSKERTEKKDNEIVVVEDREGQRIDNFLFSFLKTIPKITHL